MGMCTACNMEVADDQMEEHMKMHAGASEGADSAGGEGGEEAGGGESM